MARLRGEDGEVDDLSIIDLSIIDLGAPPPADDAPDPRRPTPRRRPSLRVALAGAAVVAVLVAGAVVRQGAVRESTGPPLDGTATAEELFPALAAAGGAGDVYPVREAQEGLGIVPDTAHVVAATPSLVFWVALDSAGEVCLVVRSLSGGDLPLRIGGACTDPAAAATQGVFLPEGDGVAATLVPRGFDTSRLAAAGDRELADGLWVDADTATLMVRESVDAVAAQPVVPTQTRTGSGALPVFLTDDDVTYAVVLSCLRTAPGVGADLTVGLTIDGARRHEDCSTDVAFRRFSGDGGPVRVDVEVPEQLVWAGRVVQCSGSLSGPICDTSRFP